jgi:flagellar motor switch protein FliG
MVTTLVGNPSLASEIFKRWIDADQEDGVYQVAAFLKATDPGLASMLAEHIGKDNIAKVEFAITQMSSIDKEGLIETFKKFREEFQREQQVRNSSSGSSDVGDLFQFLKQLETQQIFHIIKDEPVGIAAIVLAQVTPDVANTVLQELPEDVQGKVPVEMGKLKKIPLSVYKEISNKLSKKALEVGQMKFVTTDGVNALIKMLEQSTPETEQQILDRVTEQDIALSQEIRKYYITFDEITRIPDKILADILRSLDRESIIKALINSKDLVKNKVINNLAPRTKIIVSDALKVKMLSVMKYTNRGVP